MRGLAIFVCVTTAKNIETPAVSDGNGLAEALLGLSGFRVLAVTETDSEVVISRSRPPSRSSAAVGVEPVPSRRMACP